MYKPLAWSGFLGFVGLVGCAVPTIGDGRFEVDVKMAQWVDLWRTYDLDRLDDLFLTDDRLTYLSSEKEGLIVGRDAVREHHVGFGFVSGGKAPEQELWVDEVHATQLGSTAVVTAVWYFGDRTLPPAENQRGPATFVYTMDRGEYRLAHLNFGNYEASAGN